MPSIRYFLFQGGTGTGESRVHSQRYISLCYPLTNTQAARYPHGMEPAPPTAPFHWHGYLDVPLATTLPQQ